MRLWEQVREVEREKEELLTNIRKLRLEKERLEWRVQVQKVRGPEQNR